MIVLPAVDLLRGHVVQLVGGQRDTEQVELDDPLAVVAHWKKEGASWIHVVDLDAAFGHPRPNTDLVHRIVRTPGLKTQVGGGVRTEEQVRSLLAAGAERVVIGTKGLRDPMWLRNLAHRFPHRLVFAVDARDGRVVAHGWMKDTGRPLLDVARPVADLPLAALLYTAVHVEGRLQGIDREGVRALVDAVDLPVIASGGIATLDDIRFLRDVGAHAAILGLALYKDRIRFPQAQALAEAPPA